MHKKVFLLIFTFLFLIGNPIKNIILFKYPYISLSRIEKHKNGNVLYFSLKENVKNYQDFHYCIIKEYRKQKKTQYYLFCLPKNYPFSYFTKLEVLKNEKNNKLLLNLTIYTLKSLKIRK